MKLKDRIVQAAYKLFATKGYEATTVSDIIHEAGSSRGGFYHHFQSKEDILNLIVEGFVTNLENAFNEVLIQEQYASIALFNKMIAVFINYKTEQVKEWKNLQQIFLFEGSHKVFQHMANLFESLTSRVFLMIINRGISERVFRLSYPEPFSHLWARELININRKVRRLIFDMNEVDFAIYINELKFLENMINRELGLSENLILIEVPFTKFVTDSEGYFESEEG